MGYQAQIGFVIRAWEGAPDDVFDQLLGKWLPQYADECQLEQPDREELAGLFEWADWVDLVDGDGVQVMRFFDPAYKCSGQTHELLDHLQGLTEFADIEGEFVEIAGEGFSGIYCLAGEESEVESSLWGPDQDDLWDAFEYGATVRPTWMNYGIQVSASEVRSQVAGSIDDDDVCEICDEAMPEIRALLRSKARELGHEIRSAVIV